MTGKTVSHLAQGWTSIPGAQQDKMLLRKRSLIESVFNVLKNKMNLEHTRYRSPINFLIHIIACVVSYAVSKLSNFDQFTPHPSPSLS